MANVRHRINYCNEMNDGHYPVSHTDVQAPSSHLALDGTSVTDVVLILVTTPRSRSYLLRCEFAGVY